MREPNKEDAPYRPRPPGGPPWPGYPNPPKPPTKLAKKNKKSKPLTEKSDKPYSQPEKAKRKHMNRPDPFNQDVNA
tara:strand:+ start:1927 stop:2154 length:228 start_codon:yes stop_codon:yes gene_type:complete